MFGLLRRPRNTTSRYQGRTLLRLEALEWRDQPTDILPPPDDGGGVIAVNEVPAIVDFEAVQVSPGVFVITGRVVDESPGGLVVTFGGDTAGNGQTVTTLSDGTFSTTVRLPTDGTGAGYLTATVTDAQGAESQEVSVFLDPTVA